MIDPADPPLRMQLHLVHGFLLQMISEEDFGGSRDYTIIGFISMKKPFNVVKKLWK